MTFVGTIVAAVTGSGSITAQAPSGQAAGDWQVVMVTVKKMASASPGLAATLDDLIAPPVKEGQAWLRLAALSLTPSGDPAVLRDVVALYARKATGVGGTSDRHTWTFNQVDNFYPAAVSGVVLRGPIGVSSVDGPAVQLGPVDYSVSTSLPASSGKAGNGHVLRILSLIASQVLGGATENPTIRHVSLLAGETARVDVLPNVHIANERPMYWQAHTIIEAAVTASAPAAEDIASNIYPPQARTQVTGGTGWTVFLSDTAAPLPPNPVDPVDGQWVDFTDGYRLRLEHRTLGTVGDLTGIAIWRSTDDGATKAWWKASSQTWETTEQVNPATDPWLDFPAGAWANAGTEYLVGIATTGAGSTILSNYATFTVIGSDRPTASLSVLGLSGGQVADLTPQVDVTGVPAAGAGMTGWQVRIFDLLTSGRNLAPNASFESGIAGWAGKGSGYTPGACSWSPLFPTHGDHSLKITWPGGGVGAASADFVVEAGKAYTWSGYVRVPAGSPDVRASWLYKQPGTPTSVKDSPVRVTCTFVADTTGTIPLGFETTNGLPGTVYVDRIALVEGVDPGDWVYSDPDAGTPSLDSGVIGGQPGSWTVPREDALTQHNPYRAYARVRQTGGQWSLWAQVDLEPNVDAPDAPTVTVAPTTHPVSGAPCLSVAAVMPAWSGGQLRARVQRSVGGAWSDLGTDLLTADGTTQLDDWSAPSMTPCAYRVRAETTDVDGAPLNGAWSELTVAVLSDVGGWLVDPTRPETAVNVEVISFDQRSSDTQADAAVPLASDPGRPVAPIVVASVPVTDSGQATLRGLSVGHTKAVKAILSSGALLMLRWWPVHDASGAQEPGRDLLFRTVGAVTTDLSWQGPTSIEHIGFSYVGQYTNADTENSWTVVDSGVRS